MKFTRERITTLFYILAATLLVAVLFFFYLNTQRVKVTSDLVEHTEDVLRMSDNVLLDILNIETSSRGYLLSGEEAFLDPYTEGVTKIDNDLLQLENLTKDNQNQQERLVLLKKTVSEKLVLTRTLINIKAKHQLGETDKIKMIDIGKVLTDKIRSNINDINAEEFNLLKQRKIDNNNSNKNSDALFLVLLLFIVVIITLVVIIIRHQKSRNKELEAFNAAQKKTEQDLIEARIFAEAATDIAEIAKSKAEDSTKIAEEATKRAEDFTKRAEDSTKIAEAATKIANEAVKAKQQFLSNMSHEIRTPMNAIIGFTKVVLKTDLTDKQHEYLNAIKMSGDTLIVLINDILDLAKVEAGKMSFEKTPFKLAASLSAMLHVFELKIQEKNLLLIKEYDAKIPEMLMGDPVRLHQVILNLVSNAVKFTANGSITVSVSLIAENTEKITLEFAIKDTGIGISEEKLLSVFDNFQQASSDTARLFGGTGLGLAIVKQLIEAQGGLVTVKSKITEGSVFSFILDFDKTEAVPELQKEVIELNTDAKDIKILVVEDMLLNQLLMKTILDDFGFQHDMADNGNIALEKLKNNTYDIILMDLQMPELNGFEATDYIRNTLKLTLPIIALTADVTTVDVAKCKAVGMNDYIAKPIDERILYAKIMGLVPTHKTI